MFKTARFFNSVNIIILTFIAIRSLLLDLCVHFYCDFGFDGNQFFVIFIFNFTLDIFTVFFFSM